MVEPFGLPAKLVVRQAVGRISLGDDELQHAIGARSVQRAAVLVETAGAIALRERVVQHHVRRDVPGQVRATAETRLGAA